jgi:hypothetical protein
MKHLKTFDQINEQLFKGEVSLFNKLMGISVEEEGAEEPNLYPAESPSGLGSPRVPIENVNTSEMDQYGSKVGISDKSDSGKFEQPSSGPVGNIVNSAYANLNVPTRKIPGTGGGNLGCAAAVSLIFYRATGYSITGNGAITLGTSSIYSNLTKESEKPSPVWKKITNWKEAQPGDIIVTARGSKAGHTGVVVDGGNIISNSSGGFKGDKKGQIELNYNLNSWDNVAARNPSKTAAFRYMGPYKASWSTAPLA